ncbi:hypothetical protein AAFF_G00060010 [Aldrovandia affinis]|uniref:Uncharacterized protein n=1 Tax=Aldrovandia affinis TaxID=143900 RepID=A0AAD7S0A4_9TELE|nr:hypothetical protein AAFF_G00060010 [Aldrovandia affinis]
MQHYLSELQREEPRRLRVIGLERPANKSAIVHRSGFPRAPDRASPRAMPAALLVPPVGGRQSQWPRRSGQASSAGPWSELRLFESPRARHLHRNRKPPSASCRAPEGCYSPLSDGMANTRTRLGVTECFCPLLFHGTGVHPAAQATWHRYQASESRRVLTDGLSVRWLGCPAVSLCKGRADCSWSPCHTGLPAKS